MTELSIPSRLMRDFVRPMLRRPDLLQVAALCLRQKGNRKEVLLITSMGAERWILPKGWPIPGRSLAEAAQLEAWEEAGVIGQVRPVPIGRFSARKEQFGGLGFRSEVHVYRIDVEDLADDYPEASQRKRKWVTTERAAKMVREPQLQALLAAL